MQTKQSDFLLNARQKANLTTEQVSKQIGIEEVIYLKWESGENEILNQFLVPLSKILNVTVEEILNGEFNVVNKPALKETKEISFADSFKQMYSYRTILLGVLFLTMILLFFGNFIKLELLGITEFGMSGFKLMFAFSKGKLAPYYLFGDFISTNQANQLLGASIGISVIYFVFAMILLYAITVNVISLIKQKNPNNNNIITSFVIFVFALATFLLKNILQAKIISSDTSGILDAVASDAFSSITLTVLIVAIITLAFSAVFLFCKLHKEDTKQVPTIVKPALNFIYNFRYIIYPMVAVIAVIIIFLPVLKYQEGNNVILNYSIFKIFIQTILSKFSFVQAMSELGYNIEATYDLIISYSSVLAVVLLAVYVTLTLYKNIKGIKNSEGVNLANRKLSGVLAAFIAVVFAISQLMVILLFMELQDATPPVTISIHNITMFNPLFLIFVLFVYYVSIVIFYFKREKLSETQELKETKFRIRRKRANKIGFILLAALLLLGLIFR